MEVKALSELSSELLAEIKRLHFQTKKLVDQGITGGYKSAFRGIGMEFEEIREYLPGDDTRSIDWKVTARYQKPFIKSYREERELTVCIAVDVSASTLSGTKKHIREQLIAKIGAMLTLIAKNNNDKVGLLTFSDQVESYHPPRKARHAVWRILREVLSPKRHNKKTNLAATCKYLRQVLKRHSIVFIISDFIDDNFELELAALQNKHEVCAIIIRDPGETELPNAGLINFIDPETGESIVIDSSNTEVRKKYSNVAKRINTQRLSTLKRYGIDHIVIESEEEISGKLRKYFLRRGNQRSSSLSVT